jgi:hypothetical protein
MVWVRRQCWATCPTVLHLGVTAVDLMFNGESMHRLAGSCSPPTGNSCHLVDLQIFPYHPQGISFLTLFFDGII